MTQKTKFKTGNDLLFYTHFLPSLEQWCGSRVRNEELLSGESTGSVSRQPLSVGFKMFECERFFCSGWPEDLRKIEVSGTLIFICTCLGGSITPLPMLVLLSFSKLIQSCNCHQNLVLEHFHHPTPKMILWPVTNKSFLCPSYRQPLIFSFKILFF